MFHQTSFTYTRAELETLTTCVKINNSAFSGLSVFFLETGKNPSWQEALDLWGRFAEKVFAGEDIVSVFDRKLESETPSLVQ
jgi:hypothetical protein